MFDFICWNKYKKIYVRFYVCIQNYYELLFKIIMDQHNNNQQQYIYAVIYNKEMLIFYSNLINLPTEEASCQEY